MYGCDSSTNSLFSKSYSAQLSRSLPLRSRILIVVDGSIQVVPSPEPPAVSDNFGISNVIATLRRVSSATTGFDLTVATRNGQPSDSLSGVDIAGLRFDHVDLAVYDQIWLFGHNPGPVKTNSRDPADDVFIQDSAYNPLSDAELDTLTRWMNAGGGMFAAGDHHLLGASMCSRIPRVSTMRRWTIAERVPTRDFATRYDTRRPAGLLQELGGDEIDFLAEEDTVPQRIEWVPHSVGDSILSPTVRPHPLLCHPTLGPIDVLPDHMHEGRCHAFDAKWAHAHADDHYFLDGRSRPHYPSRSNGDRLLPEVVAWGRTLADPPLWFVEGEQPARRFPQIVAYDGAQAQVGRVVADSTWHHWFDSNMSGFERNAAGTGLNRNLVMIRQYHVNVAAWLAPKTWRLGQVYAAIKFAQFDYFGQELFDPSERAARTGRDAMQYFGPKLGPCRMVESIIDQIEVFAPITAQRLRDAQLPSRTDNAIPVEELMLATLGGVVSGLYADMDDLQQQLVRTGQLQSSTLIDDLPLHARNGAERGLHEGVADWQAGLRRRTDTCEEFAALARGDRSTAG